MLSFKPSEVAQIGMGIEKNGMAFYKGNLAKCSPKGIFSEGDFSKWRGKQNEKRGGGMNEMP